MVQLSDTELFEVALLDAFVRNGHLPPNTGMNRSTNKAAFNRYFSIDLVDDRLIFTIQRLVLSDQKSVQTFLQVFRVVQPFPVTQKFQFILETSTSEASSLDGARALTQELAMTYHNGDKNGRLEHPASRIYTLDLTNYHPHVDVSRMVNSFHEKQKHLHGRSGSFHNANIRHGSGKSKNPFLTAFNEAKQFVLAHPFLIIGTTAALIAVILIPVLFPAGVTAFAAPALYTGAAVSWTSLYDENVPAEEIVATLKSIGVVTED
ncbi:hypothetical protein G9A89_003827 [Geosiphon pyriformis]|nr:hypothetical protein G9A89_003827 [Geosiphon pyriformis]